MRKRKLLKRESRNPPYYLVKTADSAKELEIHLNRLCERGFTIRHVTHAEKYTIVALKPDL